jgi:hypothetical protein
MSNAIAPPDDDEYMTPAEFAALPSDVHHAVWAAFNANAIDSFPGKKADQSRPQRYHRDQVQAVMRELEAARPGATAVPEESPSRAMPAAGLNGVTHRDGAEPAEPLGFASQN